MSTNINDFLDSQRHIKEFHPGAAIPGDLISALVELCPHVAFDSWPERIISGAVYLNGRRILDNTTLEAPCKVEYFEPKTLDVDMRSAYSQFSPSHIIFEDDDLLVVFKPPKLPSLPTRDQQQLNLRAALTEYLGFAPHMPSRLDTSTAGVVITSKHPRSHRAIQQAFERGLVTKIYLAETAASVSWDSMKVDAPIGRSPVHSILRCVTPNGRRALTEFNVLARSESGTLIEARPRTGRTHQIRVHCSHLNIPIAGDRFYGGAPSESLHLLSVQATIFHPRVQRPMTFTTPEAHLPPWVAPSILSLYNP